MKILKALIEFILVLIMLAVVFVGVVAFAGIINDVSFAEQLTAWLPFVKIQR